MTDNEKPLETLLEKVDASVVGNDADLKTIMQSFGDRAFGPVLAFCGLVLITPIGAIPGVPIAISIIVISFSYQMLLGRRTPWLPESLRRIQFTRHNIRSTKVKLTPVFRRLDGLVRPRLPWAMQRSVRMFASVLSMFLALTLIPLGPVPFGVVVPSVLILLIGMAIMARDGVIMLWVFAATAAILSFLGLLII